jgi:16S rRNA (guanine966-N2)-methyltransferase
VRITGGTMTGRRIRVPGKDVRPTADLVRGALFSILNYRLAGSRFLDLFAGSGAVGLDAWSRGAAEVRWVESSRPVLAVLRDNVAVLGGDSKWVIAGDVQAVLGRGLAGSGFDIVFADPPYGWNGPERGRRQERDTEAGGACTRLADQVRQSGCLAAEGLLIIERAADALSEKPPDWNLMDERKYGGTKLFFYMEEAA